MEQDREILSMQKDLWLYRFISKIDIIFALFYEGYFGHKKLYIYPKPMHTTLWKKDKFSYP
jgi:hypothetical protein